MAKFMEELLVSEQKACQKYRGQRDKLLANARKCLEEMEAELDLDNRGTLYITIEATRKLIAECADKECEGK